MSVPGKTVPFNLSELIDASAQRHPDRVALTAPGSDGISYQQLGQQIQYQGQVLREAGIDQQDCVAVVLPNGPEMAAAFLGVASHAVCAPLNPGYRREEFEFYLADLRAKAIVLPANSDSAARDVAKERDLAVLELSVSSNSRSGEFLLQGLSVNDPIVSDGACSDDIALILHTSGTTSRPKQVPLTHSNLCHSALNIASVLKLTEHDRCLNVMPLFHIHGLVGALLSSLSAGGSVICSKGFDPETFGALVQKLEPTWYTAVPTIHQSVLTLARDDPSLKNETRLRLIRSSSSALPPSVMAALETTFQIPVVESYGMTEAAHQMASNPLPPLARKPGSVGLAAGPEIAIMNDRGDLLAAGELGEIVIRGRNVTAGYVNNSEANQSSFTDGWFRTGDLGHLDRERYLFITGRKKEMINRGGENISPREIDEILLEHSGVEQAVAFAIPHVSLGEDVVAAVVLKRESNTNEEELRQFAFSKLSDFKVPTRIVIVDSIPKGPTGKLQRIGLHEKLKSHLQIAYVTPVGEIEQKLADFWKILLDCTSVGRNDNFFLCGGDSLLATRLESRIRAEFQVEVGLPMLFQRPTLRAQAAVLASACQQAQNEMSALLDELEMISEDEARSLLERQQNCEQETTEDGRTESAD